MVFWVITNSVHCLFFFIKLGLTNIAFVENDPSMMNIWVRNNIAGLITAICMTNISSLMYCFLKKNKKERRRHTPEYIRVLCNKVLLCTWRHFSRAPSPKGQTADVHWPILCPARTNLCVSIASSPFYLSDGGWMTNSVELRVPKIK